MPRPPPSPDAVLMAQALRLRARFADPAARAEAEACLGSAADCGPVERAWAEVLRGQHPFETWLSSFEQAFPAGQVFAEGVTARQFVTRHPFVVGSPWLIRPTSPAS